MNLEPASLEQRLLALLQAVRDTNDASARLTLNDLLHTDATARTTMARLLVDEQVLISRLRDDSIVSLLGSAPVAKSVQAPRWLTWRPLTAAAAGIVLGMFGTSVVYGYVTQRVGTVKKVPLVVYNPGLESAEMQIDQGLPKAAGRWGADSAAVVPAENGVHPMEGKQMLRLEAIPPDKDVRNHTSRAYQVLDLRSLPKRDVEGPTEVQVSASFFAAKRDLPSHYLIRAVALNETPEQATKGFWPKTEDEGVVSMSQRFETTPEVPGWHTFSLKMPLPHGAQTLVFILGALPSKDSSKEAFPHYLDDVQVSVIEPQTPLSSVSK